MIKKDLKQPQRKGKYRPEMCDTVLKLMAHGKSKTQVAAALGIARSTLNAWTSDNEEFRKTMRIGETLSESFWEELGLRGTMGEIPNFKPVSWIYTMKCRFRERWMERSESKIELSGDSAKNLSDRELNIRLKALLEAEGKDNKKVI